MNISSISSTAHNLTATIHDPATFHSRLVSSIQVYAPSKPPDELPTTPTFQSKSHHSSVTPEDLSERWFIGLKWAKDTIRNTTRMFGITIEGPTNVFCDNEAVFKNTTIPESTLKKKHNSICYHRCHEAVAAKVMRVAKEGTLTNLADLFTKPLVQSVREGLLDRFTY